jgi:hypothetical protein
MLRKPPVVTPGIKNIPVGDPKKSIAPDARRGSNMDNLIEQIKMRAEALEGKAKGMGKFGKDSDDENESSEDSVDSAE